MQNNITEERREQYHEMDKKHCEVRLRRLAQNFEGIARILKTTANIFNERMDTAIDNRDNYWKNKCMETTEVLDKVIKKYNEVAGYEIYQFAEFLHSYKLYRKRRGKFYCPVTF